MKNRIKTIFTQTDGYLTIELTMIFTVLFFSLLLILFMGMVLYQEVHLQSLAVRASERGSIVYGSRVSDMATGVKTLADFENRDPYRSLPFVDSGKKNEYKQLIDSYIAQKLGNNSILESSGTNGGNRVFIDDYIILKKVRVNLQSDYDMPVASIPKMFGIEQPFHVNTTAVSVVIDSPDFVRNVDLATDVLKQTQLFGQIKNGYDKILQAIQKVQSFFEK